MVILTVIGLYTRKPVLELWLALVAIGGVIASIAARWQIHNSEGTLAGRGMAKLAMGLSVVFGCVYVAYYWGNMVAIRRQAVDFAQQWLTTLSNKNPDEAFLLTIPPAERKGMKAANAVQRFPERSERFRSMEFVGIFTGADRKEDVVVEPLGVRDMTQIPEGNNVTLQYLIKSRSGEYECSVTALGMEGADFPGRQWVVPESAPFIQRKRLSVYGRLVWEARMDAERVMGEWIGGVLSQNGVEAQVRLATLPLSRAERDHRYSEFVVRGSLAPILAAAMIPMGAPLAAAGASAVTEAAQPICLPDAEAAWKQLIHYDTSRQDLPPQLKEELRPKLLHSGNIQPAATGEQAEISSQIEFERDRIRVAKPVRFTLPAPVGYTTRGQLVATTVDQELAKHLDELRSAKWDANTPLQTDDSQSVLNKYKHEWYISAVIVDLAREEAPSRPTRGRPNAANVPGPGDRPQGP
ncbi:MAG: hypothetical protein ACJ8F7_13365 [Gemmataceae bacterium]